MSTPEECEGAKPKVSKVNRGWFEPAAAETQFHVWRPTMVTQPIEFGTFACKCTASRSSALPICPEAMQPHQGWCRRQVQFHRWWSRNPLSLALLHASALQAEARPCRNVQKQCSLTRVGAGDKCRPCAGVHTLQTSGCGCCTRCSKSCRQVTLCRHWLQVSYILQAEAAGKTHGAVAACGCRSASHCCGCCTRCRPSRGWCTRCGHGLRMAYQAEGSTHWAAIGCGCLATRCGQGCGYFTLCRQRFAGETRVAAMVAGASRGALVRAISHRGARGKVKAVRTVKLTLPAEPRGWSLH